LPVYYKAKELFLGDELKGLLHGPHGGATFLNHHDQAVYVRGQSQGISPQEHGRGIEQHIPVIISFLALSSAFLIFMIFPPSLVV
jgi:hypothetical protein